MSTVYRGTDMRLERPVAIKVMDPRFAADPTFLQRFEREARAAARLHHPGVVAVHDQGVDFAGDHAFLVMELVEGATLRDLMRQHGRLPVPLAITVAEMVLSALAAAHREGLVHRDIKPENVLIGPGGVVKVADFGLVRAAAEASSTGDVILGTVAYLSPEQVATGTADARSDVYATGVLLFEMLTAAPPYGGETALSVAYRHVNDDMPAPSTAGADVPAALDDLIVQATRRDPAVRPSDASAFLRDLQAVRTGLGIDRVAVPLPTSTWSMAAAGPPTAVAGLPTDHGPSGTRALSR
ncbi:MAG TPA: protein kinase, partial [Pseudonocardiaceae bacterium]|nr:protein kinase [Pseudonocardiaceae bacterium]